MATPIALPQTWVNYGPGDQMLSIWHPKCMTFTCHVSAPDPAPLSNFRTCLCQRVKKFAPTALPIASNSVKSESKSVQNNFKLVWIAWIIRIHLLLLQSRTCKQNYNRSHILFFQTLAQRLIHSAKTGPQPVLQDKIFKSSQDLHLPLWVIYE